MNCENCKNKQATVFYADDSGGRHALCASCAQIMGKISQYPPEDQKGDVGKLFVPEPTLSSLTEPEINGRIYLRINEEGGRAVCTYCATTLQAVAEKGRVGCPECYTVFSDLLFPSSLSPESAGGARMPSARRAAIDRLRSVSELKAQLRLAVESENFELAATLRDKIRKLEGSRRA